MGHGTGGMKHSMRDFDAAPQVKRDPSVQSISPMPVDRMGEPGQGLEDVGHKVLTYHDLVALDRNPDVRAAQRSLDIHPPHPKTAGKLALSLLDANRHDEAEVLLTGMLRADPNSWQNYYYLGAVYAHARKYKLAIDAYEKYLDLAPKSESERDRVKRAILELNIPTGIPLVYELDDDLRPRGSRYLASDAEIAAAQHKVAAQGKASPR